MHTIYTILRFGLGLLISLSSFLIFVFIEVYVVDAVDTILIEKGITGEFLGFTYSQILWAICIILICTEAIIFVVNFIWRRIVNVFKEMFSI